jgi:hypothetical protein
MFLNSIEGLFQATAYYLPDVSPSAFSGIIYWKFMWRWSCPTPFSSVLRPPCPICCVFLFCSLLILFFSHGVGVSLSRELCWFIPGVAMGILRASYLLTCWSASPKQVWNHCLLVREPSCFLSVTWHIETLYGLGVQGVRVLILLGGFFLPSVAPASQTNFWSMELMLSASAL